MNPLEINENLLPLTPRHRSVRRGVKNSVSGLYSEEMRSSRVRALEWRSQSSCEKQGDHVLFL